ncbi:MAG TPA: hypothetical protein PK335_05325 [Draconibacterium sp.]|nr:hypothetical protein [Draconibacterium sp.]
MEYNEIEKLWNKYDEKLNTLTTMNKLVLTKTIAQSSQKTINWLQYRNYYSIILVPLMLIFLLHPYLIPFNPDIKIIAGTLLLLTFIGYSIWHFISGINQLKKVDVVNDSVIESVNKINRYNTSGINRIKAQIISGPMLLAALLLIVWDKLTFNPNFFVAVAALAFASFLFAKRHLNQHKQRIEKLLSDVEELKYYKD